MIESRIKICLISPSPPPYGGIANWTKLLSDYLNRPESKIDCFMINTAPPLRELDGRTIVQRIAYGAKSILSAKRQLKELCKNEQLDAVHITTSGSLALFRDCVLLKACARHGVRSVYHIRHGRIPSVFGSKVGFEKWLMKKALRCATSILVLDPRTADSLRKNGFEPLEIPNPIDLTILPDIDYPTKPHMVMFLGWVIPEQGIDELLEAWDILSEENLPDGTELLLVGPVSEQYQRELGMRYTCEKVKFMGELPHDEALELLSKSRIFIFPSHTEGFPNAVLEAMGLGRAVIATNVGAVGTMLSHACGIVLDKGDPETIAAAIKHVLNDDEKTLLLSQNAMEKVNREYNIDRVVEKYWETWSGKQRS